MPDYERERERRAFFAGLRLVVVVGLVSIGLAVVFFLLH